MEHSYEAYRAKAEELLRDTVCTVGLGAKKLTDAAKRQLEIADLHAEVNTCLRELGELLYATHTGTPTDSDLLLGALGWMCQRESSITIHTKSLNVSYLTMDDASANLWSVVFMAVIPLLLAVSGAVIMMRRRKR